MYFFPGQLVKLNVGRGPCRIKLHALSNMCEGGPLGRGARCSLYTCYTPIFCSCTMFSRNDPGLVQATQGQEWYQSEVTFHQALPAPRKIIPKYLADYINLQMCTIRKLQEGRISGSATEITPLLLAHFSIGEAMLQNSPVHNSFLTTRLGIHRVRNAKKTREWESWNELAEIKCTAWIWLWTYLLVCLVMCWGGGGNARHGRFLD